MPRRPRKAPRQSRRRDHSGTQGRHDSDRHRIDHCRSATTSSTSSTGTSSTQDYEAQVLNKIQFSQAPSAVQSGLTTLASTDGLTAPAATDTVYLGNSQRN